MECYICYEQVPFNNRMKCPECGNMACYSCFKKLDKKQKRQCNVCKTDMKTITLLNGEKRLTYRTILKKKKKEYEFIPTFGDMSTEYLYMDDIMNMDDVLHYIFDTTYSHESFE